MTQPVGTQCPFCDAPEPKIVRLFEKWALVCTDEGCAATGPARRSVAEAQRAWERRPQVHELRNRILELQVRDANVTMAARNLQVQLMGLVRNDPAESPPGDAPAADSSPVQPQEPLPE